MHNVCNGRRCPLEFDEVGGGRSNTRTRRPEVSLLFMISIEVLIL